MISGLIWYFIDPSRVAFVIVSILIVACPCAIALSVPFTFGNGIRILGRKEAYLRAISVIEPMSTVTDIVFDKTGTITQNNLSSITWEGEPLTENQRRIVKQLTDNSSHPLSRQISKYLNTGYKGEITAYEEISGKGIIATTNGHVYKIGSKIWLNQTFDDEKTRVCLVVDDVFVGAFVIENTYRNGLRALFNKLGEAQYKLHILSGDNAAEYEKLKPVLPEGTVFNFNQKPEGKLDYIKALQVDGKNVMMLGDGLNDAGALQQSDIGVSVVDDVYSFTPSSDIILNGDKLRYLDKYIGYAKANLSIVKWSYAFSILYNSIGLGFAITGHLKPIVAAILMPMSSISVVLLVTVLTNLKGKRLP